MVLIIVVGISGLLASLALAFMAKVWYSSLPSSAVVRDTQLKIMLHAACAYVLEAGRMGYGPKPRLSASYPMNGMIQDKSDLTTAIQYQHKEAFGWIDVRTNNLSEPGRSSSPVGPLDQNYDPVYTGSAWPAVQGVVICPMYRWQVPRYAISPRVNYNPIETDPTKNNYGYPFMSVPDPQPLGMQMSRDAVANDGSLTPTGILTNQATLNGLFTRFVFAESERAGGGGNPSPVPDSMGLAWFRVMRRSPSTFIVTCGAGGTMGFKSWDEVISRPSNLSIPRGIGDPSVYFPTRALFDSLRAAESISWYEIRWSASVKVFTGLGVYIYSEFQLPKDALPYYPWSNIQRNPILPFGSNAGQTVLPPINQSSVQERVGEKYDEQTGGRTGINQLPGFSPNHLGTISYIQRLDAGVGADGTMGYIQPMRNATTPTRIYTDW